jgi:hypothetical protein
MSIYHRYGKGPFEPSPVQLTLENMEEYYQEAVTMDAELKWMDSLNGLKRRVNNKNEEANKLFPKEYLIARLEKIQSDPLISKIPEEIIKLKDELSGINVAMKQQLAVVLDKEMGTNPLEHKKMSELDDRRKNVEDELHNWYKITYEKIYHVLPKIFYLIIDGCDIETVKNCFAQLQKVLSGQITAKSATDNLMAESSEKYNLPKGFWDPMLKSP